MARGKKLSIVVFVDAFGWRLAQRISFLDELLTTKQPLETIFGYSSTCDPTFLTGKMPREHGHFAFYYYSPSTSPFKWYRLFGVLPQSLMSRGRVRSRLSKITGKLHGYTGYFQLYNMPFEYLHLFDYSEKRDIFWTGGINSGAPTVLDYVRERGVPHVVAGWQLPESRRKQIVREAVEAGDVQFAFCYLGSLDATLHNLGTHSAGGVECLRGYETYLRELYEVAKRKYADVRMVLFSDHGMTDITSVLDLRGMVDGLGLGFGVDYAAVYDSTMARFWFLNDAARERIVGLLQGIPEGHIMSEQELARYGCDFEDRKYGEMFFLLNPGVLLCPSFMGASPLAAMHGYAPEDEDSTATFMANVEFETPPTRLDDLYDLMIGEVQAVTGN